MPPKLVINDDRNLGASIQALPSAGAYPAGQLNPYTPSSLLQRLCSTQGDDVQARDVTVTVSCDGVSSFGGAAQALTAPIAGRCTWGTGGCTHTLDFDVGVGVSFTVHGSSVQVDVQNEGDPNQPVNVKASLAYGSRGNNELYRSFNVAILNPAAAMNFVIPPFAWGVMFMPAQAQFNDDIRYDLIQLGNGIDPRMEVLWGNAATYPLVGDAWAQFWQLNNNARLIQLFNGGTDDISGRLLFALRI